MSDLFGGSKQKSSSTSSNRAFDSLQGALNPVVGQTAGAASSLNALLSGDMSGFNRYKDATGFNFAAEQGSRGVTGNAAAKGLLRSGSTGKALVNYGNNLQQRFAGNYMDRLMGLGQMGLGAAGTLAQAGQQSNNTSTGKSKNGFGGFLGSMASGIAASDPRLKTNITKLGEWNGLGIYQYDYISGSGPHIGVMADEVKVLVPEALGPVIDGYMTVDYGKLREIVNG